MHANGQANRIDVLPKFEIDAFICILKVTQLNQRRVRGPADPVDVKEKAQWRSKSTRSSWPSGGQRVWNPADPVEVKEKAQWRSKSTNPADPVEVKECLTFLYLTRATQLTNSRGKTTRPSLSKTQLTQLTQLTSGSEKVRYPAEAFADNNCATHLTGEVKEYASQLTHVVRPGVLLAQGRDRDEEDQLRHWQDDQEVFSHYHITSISSQWPHIFWHQRTVDFNVSDPDP
jgi:hypothetical protein